MALCLSPGNMFIVGPGLHEFNLASHLVWVVGGLAMAVLAVVAFLELLDGLRAWLSRRRSPGRPTGDGFRVTGGSGRSTSAARSPGTTRSAPGAWGTHPSGRRGSGRPQGGYGTRAPQPVSRSPKGPVGPRYCPIGAGVAARLGTILKVHPLAVPSLSSPSTKTRQSLPLRAGQLSVPSQGASTV